MSKYERRRFFEELCRLRALYVLRSEYDAAPVMPIEEVPAYAIALLQEASPGELSAMRSALSETLRDAVEEA